VDCVDVFDVLVMDLCFFGILVCMLGELFIIVEIVCI